MKKSEDGLVKVIKGTVLAMACGAATLGVMFFIEGRYMEASILVLMAIFLGVVSK